ncbi:DNA polymerase epsilon subunit 4 [Plodia interpunctella]|uniref:DNA polymerase epsilon subunit 4 n=1 Tax=Plodia interpunctella TaxID=58824 RepID=UPI002368D05F|nr:DNA polymerase epsilon subunit 4 [Plodia interpunctella]
MVEEEHYTDISDIIEDTETENFMDSEQQNIEPHVMEIPVDQASELLNSEEAAPTETKPPNQSTKSEVVRSTRLPMGRIKSLIKMDPDVSVVSADAVFLITKATELFLETIVKETYSYTSTNKRKVISKKDLDLIINKVDCLCFLEGAMDF